MFNLKKCLFIPFFLLSTFVYSQNNILQGRVISSKEDIPLSGATILLKGTNNSTVSASDGSFTLRGASNESTLLVSYTGYLKREVAVKSGDTNIMVALEQSSNSMEEVVVIGYGKVRKADLTGAVSSVKGSELITQTSPSVAQMLQGRAAGLVINTTSAQPGGGFSFNIRGLTSTGIGNEPLVIVDGYAISNSNTDPVANPRYNTGFKNTSLSSINPMDIESIEVLKDASATAIYGARAGHGVILITTKRGKSGKTIVEYSANATTQKIMKRPEMLNGPDYMRQTNRFLYERYLVSNSVFPYGTRLTSEVTAPFTARYTDQQIANATTTDWYDLITRDGFLLQNNLSVRGGNENTKYMVSFNAYNHDGIVKENSFDRFTGRFNLDQKFGKYLTGGVSFTLSRLKNNNFANTSLGELSDRGVITNSMWFSPILPAIDPDGKYPVNPNYPNMPNPLSLLEISDLTETNRNLANSYLEVQPIKNLVFRGTLGFDHQNGQGNSYIPKSTLFGQRQNGRADKTLQNNKSWQYELTANYTKVFSNVHNLSLLAGYSQQEFSNDFFSAGNANFLTDSYLFNNLAQGTLSRPDVASSATKTSIAGTFGRLMYNYSGKYYFQGTVRRDGSSDFAANNKWATFPSMAVAWRVSEEPFLKRNNKISNLKLRASWGRSGNAGLGGNANAYYGNSGNYILGNTVLTGIRLIQLANPNLKWETTTEVNLGVDIGFLNNRITFTAERYHRVISDLLSFRNLPNYQELTRVAANIGQTQSDGLELTLNTVNLDKPDFTWNSAFTLSYYFDRWKERDPSWVPSAWESVDDPIRQNVGWLDDGLIRIGERAPWILNPIPGQVKYRDLNGFQRDATGNIVYDAQGRGLKTGKSDGRLDDADVAIWQIDRPYFLGLSNTVRYKIFDLNIYLYGVLNRVGSNPNQQAQGSNLTVEGLNVSNAVKNAFTHDNPNGSPWLEPNSFTRKLGVSNVENMSFVRVKDISLGVSVPKNVLPRFVQNLRASITASNLFLFTQYSGWDPETDYGIGAYPNPRSISFGINVGL